MFEEAKSLDVMMKKRNLSQKEAANMLGVSQSYIANKLRLLKLSTDLQEKILSSGLSERHARALLKLKAPESQRIALDKICDQKMSVAESEAMIDVMLMSKPTPIFSKAERLKAIESFISQMKGSIDTIRSFGAAASMKTSYERNRVYISIFISEND